MNLENSVELFKSTINEGEKYLLEIYHEFRDLEKNPFEKLGFIYEVGYEGIRVLNRAINPENSSLWMEGYTNPMNLNLKGMEEHLVALVDTLPADFTKGEEFVVRIPRKIDISLAKPHKVDFRHMEKIIDRQKISYIKFLHEESCVEIHYSQGAILNISSRLLTEKPSYQVEKKNTLQFIYANGWFKESKVSNVIFIIETQKNRFLEVRNLTEPIMVLYAIDAQRNQVLELIRRDNAEDIEKVVLFTVDGDQVPIQEEDYTKEYKALISPEKSDD